MGGRYSVRRMRGSDGDSDGDEDVGRGGGVAGWRVQAFARGEWGSWAGSERVLREVGLLGLGPLTPASGVVTVHY